MVSFLNKTSLVVNSVILGIAATIAASGYFYSVHAKQQFESSLNNLNAQQMRFKQLNNKTLIAKKYLDKFNDLAPYDRYLTEDRLGWINTFENIREQLQLDDIDFNISSVNRYKFEDGLIKRSGLNIQVSDITLRSAFIHETRFLEYLDLLNQQMTNPYVLSKCKLINLVNARSVSRINMNTECQIRVFTFEITL